ncbi:MAG: hypothetical protein ABIK28_21255, partial [Planctomycetota bacterium]
MANRRSIEDRFTLPRRSMRLPNVRRAGRTGSVLVPCLLFLSLVGITALGLLELTRSEIGLSHELDNEYNALLAARCGIEFGLNKAQSSETYTGETIHTAESGSWEIQVKADDTNTLLRTVKCTATLGPIQSQITEQVYCYPRHYNYALILAGDFILKDRFKVFGDVYVAGELKGETGSLITGDVHLYQPRTLLSDIGGDVISVDGNTIPTVQGEVLDGQAYLAPAGWSLSVLKTAAAAKGQVYSSNQRFENLDMTGVVYLEQGVNAEFRNVTIRGVLVGETAEGFSTIINSAGDSIGEIIVKNPYYLKIISDSTVAEDIGILAPGYKLNVEDNTDLDVLGTVYVGYVDLHSNGHMVVTGPT